MQTKTDASVRKALRKSLPMTILPTTAVSTSDGFTVYIETVKLKKRSRRPRA